MFDPSEATELQVESGDSLETAHPMHRLRELRRFPAEVAFQGFGGNIPRMEEMGADLIGFQLVFSTCDPG